MSQETTRKTLPGGKYSRNVFSLWSPKINQSRSMLLFIYAKAYMENKQDDFSTLWIHLCIWDRNFWQVSPKNQNYAVTSKKGKKMKSCIVILLLLTPECELEEIHGKYLEEHTLLGSCCHLRKSRKLNCRWLLIPTKSLGVRPQDGFFCSLLRKLSKAKIMLPARRFQIFTVNISSFSSMKILVTFH